MTSPRYNPKDVTLRNARASKRRDDAMLLRIRKLEQTVRWLVRLRKSVGKKSADD